LVSFSTNGHSEFDVQCLKHGIIPYLMAQRKLVGVPPRSVILLLRCGIYARKAER